MVHGVHSHCSFCTVVSAGFSAYSGGWNDARRTRAKVRENSRCFPSRRLPSRAGEASPKTRRRSAPISSEISPPHRRPVSSSHLPRVSINRRGSSRRSNRRPRARRFGVATCVGRSCATRLRTNKRSPRRRMRRPRVKVEVAEPTPSTEAPAPAIDTPTNVAVTPRPTPVGSAPRPRTRAAGGVGGGSRGGGLGGIGEAIGTVIGVVIIRGGAGGVDHCDPRTDRRADQRPGLHSRTRAFPSALAVSRTTRMPASPDIPALG